MNNIQRALQILNEAVKPKECSFGIDENFSNKEWISESTYKRTFFKYKESLYFVGLVSFKDGVSISFGLFKNKIKFDFNKINDNHYIIDNFDFKASNLTSNSSIIFSNFFYIALEGCNKFNYDIFYIVPMNDENPKLEKFYSNLIQTKIFLNSIENEYKFKLVDKNGMRFER